MRLAYVSTDPGVPVFGCKGASVHVQEVIRALVRRGAEVTLLATRLGGETPRGLERVRVVELPRPEGTVPDERERAAIANNGVFARSLVAAGPFDAVYERHALWSSAVMEYARDAGIPAILEVNSPLVQEQASYRALVNTAAAAETAARAFGAASAVFAVSDTVAEYVRRACPAVRRVEVVPNGVDTGRFHPAIPPAVPPDAGSFTVGFVGTLKPWHGLSVLAEAFGAVHREAPGARLLIVGEGPCRADVERDLDARGLGAAATLTGPVDPARVPGLLTSMDVAVAPYPPLDDFYFSPLKLFEYMAAGRAIVASRIGQVEAVIRDGVTGVLCRPGDPAELAAALVSLRGDPERRRALGAAARAAAKRDHTWDTVAGRILDAAACPVAGRSAGAEAISWNGR